MSGLRPLTVFNRDGAALRMIEALLDGTAAQLIEPSADNSFEERNLKHRLRISDLATRNADNPKHSWKTLSVAVVLRSLGLRGRGAELKKEKSDKLINQKAKPFSHVAMIKERTFYAAVERN